MDRVEKEHGFHIDLSRLKLEENNPLVTHLHFESAVCKIQNDEPHNMNELEKIADCSFKFEEDPRRTRRRSPGGLFA